MEQSAEVTYIWDFETVVKDIPKLKELDIGNNQIKRISEKLAIAVHRLLKDLKGEVKVNIGKRQNLFNKSLEKIKKVHPEKLAGMKLNLKYSKIIF